MNINTLLFIKLITNNDLLNGSGNYLIFSNNLSGKNLKKEYIYFQTYPNWYIHISMYEHIYKTESLFCTPETDTVLYIKYILVKKINHSILPEITPFPYFLRQCSPDSFYFPALPFPSSSTGVSSSTFLFRGWGTSGLSLLVNTSSLYFLSSDLTMSCLPRPPKCTWLTNWFFQPRQVHMGPFNFSSLLSQRQFKFNMSKQTHYFFSQACSFSSVH